VQSVLDYAIYMLTPDGVVKSWNAGAERIKGYTPEEIIGRHFSQFYTPEDREAGRPARGLEIAAREGRFEAEGWRVRKDGSRFWASVVIDAIYDDDGGLAGFAKVTRDLTDRRHAEQALRDSERRFRLLVDGVTDYAIYMLDPEGRVTNWNVGAQRIKGFAADEVIGSHFSRFYTDEDRALGIPATALSTAAETGRFEAEGWRVRKDGVRFWASVVIDAIRGEDGVLLGFAKVTRDITERRDAQTRLEEAREQLFQSQKMEALGQLTGGLAHDFNNLLTAIMSGTELALRHKDNPARLDVLLQGVLTSAKRGGSLTRQLLAFARRQPLEATVVDPREHLLDCAALIRHSLSAEIELITECSDQLWRIETDPGQLQLALLNLAFNARDAMPDGGRMRLSATNVELEGAPEGLVGEFVAVSLTDSGSGIPQDIRDRVLEPFFTTKGFGQGTGLGLSQVYGFARQSRGGLVIDSVEGEGTTVTIYLPAITGRMDRDASSDPRASARVLIVEDDPVVAELATHLLEELGYEGRIVHSAKEALARLSREADIDLVFSDIIMPGGISGLELARKLRERFPELPILLTTGYSDRMADEAREFPLLPKPYDFDALEKAIGGLLPQRQRAPARSH
jgi:PAS domain S-box-containing protein